MSGSRAAAAAGAAGRPQTGRGRLAASVDLAVLVGVGWDPVTQVFTPDPAHRLLGYRVCAVPGCGSEAWCRDGLCGGCASRRAGDPGQPIEAFWPRGSVSGGAPVSGCARCVASPVPAARPPPTACA